MRDMVISGKRLKMELITLAICFFIGFLANIGAILFYDGKAFEVLSSLHYVLIFTFVIYIIWTVFRIVFFAASKLIVRKKK